MSSCSQIFSAEALLRSDHEMAERFAPNANARELPLIHADPYLNNLLLKYSEAAITDRRDNVSHLRTKVENAISSLLPHGRVVVDHVARNLGMTKRTLARKLSDEGLNFTEVLQQLRRDVAVRYLDDPKLDISKIAWLLGFNEVSAFTRAFKRWTGKTPSQMRTTAVSLILPGRVLTGNGEVRDIFLHLDEASSISCVRRGGGSCLVIHLLVLPSAPRDDDHAQLASGPQRFVKICNRHQTCMRL